MSRLSFRPRPLDIHKKLPIVKSFKDFDDDEAPTSTRNSQFLRAVPEVENEVHPAPSKKVGTSEIPTPQFVVVDTYERDYSCTFSQPTSYLRARGARAEIGEFIEYDLDNEDEDWLSEFNEEINILTPEMFECLLFKLEVLDHKARERAGLITPTLGSPILVQLRLDTAMEALQVQSIKYTVIQSVYEYWKEKRESWQKPILRRLQPPPPVNDTNPYNVFRPREKAHKLHTRRMQRRENNLQSFEKLRQVRRNLDQAKGLLEDLIKREEKKREVMESEVTLQRMQMKYKNEAEFLEDNLAPAGFTPVSSKFVSSEEEFFDSDDVMTNRLPRPSAVQNLPSYDTNLPMVPAVSTKQVFKRRYVPREWPHKLDPLEPVLLFTKPLLPHKLAMAGIMAPNSITKNGMSQNSYKFRGRMGRGGRIIFDRWNPLMQTPIDCGNSFYVPPKPHSSQHVTN
ncbi:PREDICTED: enhancer of polycomb-like protein 1 isoform X2 [Lupinus angustifolius]|uniref:enhancer of polycomb-like protein 1 isoform X1 n=1 Tax=Lupinus angustifolius TaxID=3871 RepID=UPI00092E7BBA|nr:PREDICTED: enhancer of polycomb-like protein 1 isoform X1 [Lupinus angustifolius]XP_019442811.1 PREDICTED: enhancer of polycomb-like protein 1 isoform X1 [Lupinus angustifolius]XP_019442812.1 PREDICTED: enhancer of polycomb-like protein 1 isoform X1 [Lupinus angustifolius]XP_019442813.1 PREDICTED: enhancer of polycomb-like protein 1 isoform X2 [Lupinus angustifolius]